METRLLLYTPDDDGNALPFPNADEQVELLSFDYSAQSMGGTPTIAGTFYHSSCLDELWNDNVYTEFKGEKYYLKNTPSSSIDNTDMRYKHEIELVSERFALDNIYFYDTVRGDAVDGKYVSNSTKFEFMGTIAEFASRLNAALQYSGLQKLNADGTYKEGYQVVIDTATNENYDTSSFNHVTFEDQFISQALQQIYEVYEIPYYFEGKTIHIGDFPTLLVDANDNTAFEYGFENAFLSVGKANANSKVITRCTGTGSSENIPYYYPNATELGDVILNAWTREEGSGAQADISSVFRFNKNVIGNKFVYKYATDGWEHPIDFLTAGVGLYLAKDNPDMEYYVNKHTVEVFFNADIAVKDLLRVCVMRYKFGPKCKCALYYLPDGVYQRRQDDNNLWEVTYDTEIEVGVMQELSHAITNQFDKYNDIQFSASGIYKLVVYTDINYEIDAPLTFSAGKYAFTFGPTNDQDKWISVYYRHIREAATDDGWYLINPDSGSHIRTELSSYGIKLTEGTLPAKGTILPTGQDRDTYFAATITIAQEEGTVRIPFQTTLMPPIYRESKGEERFYNALNDTYPKEGSTTGCWDFKNEFVEGRQKEHIEKFEDIKPTITGMVNADSNPIDTFIAFEYDTDDNDTIDADDDNTYVHSYFFAKLPKMNGENGFNLFDCASEQGDMTFSMTTGNCAACNFVLGVDGDTKKNTVQVDENGNLMRDEKGNVKFGVPQDKQNDTENNEVWVALMKEEDTFGIVMPNATHNYKPTAGDKFVITNISLPTAYITAAEERLKQAILGYMYDNNLESFDFSLKFSRIFLQENPNILENLNENSKIYIKYNDITYDLFVKSYSYKQTSSEALPEITIEVSRKLGTNTNALLSTISGVERKITDRLNSMPTLDQVKDLYVRKDTNDAAYGNLTLYKKMSSLEGIDFGNFVRNVSGASIYRDDEGSWHHEVDYLKVRKKTVFDDVEIKESHHIGGEQISTVTSCVCDLVVEKKDSYGYTFYRCYFKKAKSDGEMIENQWRKGDQALCKTFNLFDIQNGSAGNRFWWRLVIDTSNDITELDYAKDTDGYKTIDVVDYHFIDISGVDEDEYRAENSTTPRNGDKIIQFGYRYKDEYAASRTNAIVQSSSGEGAPYYRQYKGIVDFSLPEYDTNLSPNGNLLTGVVTIQEGSKGAENLTDLPDMIKKSVSLGGENLLRNTGFDGEYESIDLSEDTSIVGSTETYYNRMVLWFGDGGTSVVDVNAISGYSCQLDGSITQSVKLREGTDYTISFIESGSVSVSVGGTTLTEKTIDEEYSCYSFKGTSNGTIEIKFSSEGGKITNLKMERGSVRTDWQPSQLDNDPMTEKFKTLWYLQHAITEGKTDILGGLVLTSIINLTNLDSEQITAGMSGVCNSDNDIAFWGGGDLEKAVTSIAKVKGNQKLTEAEWKDLIGFCVTHGGDAFFKGYVYALGGKFKGTIEATDGKFKGTIEATDGSLKNVHSPNNAWRIDEDGNVLLQGGTISNTWESNGTYFKSTISDSSDIFKVTKGESDDNIVIGIGTTLDENTRPHIYIQDASEYGHACYVYDDEIYLTKKDSATFIDIIADSGVVISNDYGYAYIQSNSMGLSTGAGQTTIFEAKEGVKADGTTKVSFINVGSLPTWNDVSGDDIPVGTLYRDDDTVKVKH